MEQLINKIFIETGFDLIDQNISFYSKENKSFFFKVLFDESEFSSLKSKELVRQNEKYKKIIDDFKVIVNSGENVVIEKNSSLLILVKCQSVNALENLRQQILMFEEDEYFLKKYVILYTEQSISDLVQEPILEMLTSKLINLDNLYNFASNGYRDEIAEYIAILQLFIKLPFLTLNIDQSGFIPLDQKINSELGSLKIFHDKMIHEDLLFQEIDFLNIDNDSKIDELINSLPQ